MEIKNGSFVFLSRLLITVSLAILAIPLSGQVENHLILKKRGYIDKMHFLSGNPITFVREGNKYAEEGLIQGIGTDYIIVSGLEIPISKISYIVKVRDGFNYRASGKVLLIAAPAYLLIGFANELIHQRNTGSKPADLLPTRNNLIVAGSLLTAGAILPTFQVRKYPIKKKFTLRIVQSDPAFNK